MVVILHPYNIDSGTNYESVIPRDELALTIHG